MADITHLQGPEMPEILPISAIYKDSGAQALARQGKELVARCDQTAYNANVDACSNMDAVVRNLSDYIVELAPAGKALFRQCVSGLKDSLGRSLALMYLEEDVSRKVAWIRSVEGHVKAGMDSEVLYNEGATFTSAYVSARWAHFRLYRAENSISNLQDRELLKAYFLSEASKSNPLSVYFWSLIEREDGNEDAADGYLLWATSLNQPDALCDWAQKNSHKNDTRELYERAAKCGSCEANFQLANLLKDSCARIRAFEGLLQQGVFSIKILKALAEELEGQDRPEVKESLLVAYGILVAAGHMDYVSKVIPLLRDECGAIRKKANHIMSELLSVSAEACLTVADIGLLGECDFDERKSVQLLLMRALSIDAHSKEAVRERIRKLYVACVDSNERKQLLDCFQLLLEEGYYLRTTQVYCLLGFVYESSDIGLSLTLEERKKCALDKYSNAVLINKSQLRNVCEIVVDGQVLRELLSRWNKDVETDFELAWYLAESYYQDFQLEEDAVTKAKMKEAIVRCYKLAVFNNERKGKDLFFDISNDFRDLVEGGLRSFLLGTSLDAAKTSFRLAQIAEERANLLEQEPMRMYMAERTAGMSYASALMRDASRFKEVFETKKGHHIITAVIDHLEKNTIRRDDVAALLLQFFTSYAVDPEKRKHWVLHFVKKIKAGEKLSDDVCGGLVRYFVDRVIELQHFNVFDGDLALIEYFIAGVIGELEVRAQKDANVYLLLAHQCRVEMKYWLSHWGDVPREARKVYRNLVEKMRQKSVRYGVQALEAKGVAFITEDMFKRLGYDRAHFISIISAVRSIPEIEKEKKKYFVMAKYYKSKSSALGVYQWCVERLRPYLLDKTGRPNPRTPEGKLVCDFYKRWLPPVYKGVKV